MPVKGRIFPPVANMQLFINGLRRCSMPTRPGIMHNPPVWQGGANNASSVADDNTSRGCHQLFRHRKSSLKSTEN
jgi:hypothetical protein